MNKCLHPVKNLQAPDDGGPYFCNKPGEYVYRLPGSDAELSRCGPHLLETIRKSREDIQCLRNELTYMEKTHMALERARAL